MSDYLLSLPLELLEYTFYTFVEPYDIAAVNQTCKALHAVTGTASAFFWRNLFLSQPYDDPRSHSSKARSTFDWRGVVTSRVRAERTKTEAPLLDALTECVRNIPPHSATPSADIAWAEKMIGLHLDVFEDYPLPNCESDITSEELVDIKVDLALVDPIAAEKRMLIRSLFSQRLRPSSYTASARRRTARAFVYNMRNYTESSRYGPLLSGASAPSWTHVDALVTVIAANLSDFGDEWPAQLRPPALLRGAESLRAYSGARVRTSPVDWAGIEGEWLRVVCFCDYRDLIRFNRGRCRPDFFHDEFEEATRLLRLRLTCTGIAAGEDSADPVRPALRFEGRMHGLSSHESLARGVRGVVRVMPNGDIRWSFVSFYEGEEQWSSEGVQLGGAGSAAGVVGAWSGASHSPSDPAGPFWLFKVNDESALDKIHAWPL